MLILSAAGWAFFVTVGIFFAFRRSLTENESCRMKELTKKVHKIRPF